MTQRVHIPGGALAHIARAVAHEFGVTIEDLRWHDRVRSKARARWAAWVISRQLTDKSLPEIGLWYGGKDHTTILYGLRQWPKKATKEMVQKMEAALEASKQSIERDNLQQPKAIFVTRRAEQEWAERFEKARLARIESMWSALVGSATLSEIETLLEQAKKGQAA